MGQQPDQQTSEQLIERAVADSDFRLRLINYPAVAIGEVIRAPTILVAGTTGGVRSMHIGQASSASSRAV